MKQSLGLVSLVVRDYDEAIGFFVGTLGFRLVEDTFVPEQSKRWVVVSPPGATECPKQGSESTFALPDKETGREVGEDGSGSFLE